MAGTVGADLAVMQQASQHVNDVNEQIQQQLNQLVTRLEGLSGAWRGDASKSFEFLRQQWNEDAGKLNVVLRQIGEALARSGQNYAQTETTATGGFSRIASGLTG